MRWIEQDIRENTYMNYLILLAYYFPNGERIIRMQLGFVQGEPPIIEILEMENYY